MNFPVMQLKRSEMIGKRWRFRQIRCVILQIFLLSFLDATTIQCGISHP